MRHSPATVIELNAAHAIDFEAVWTRNKKSNAYFGFNTQTPASLGCIPKRNR